MFHDKIQGVRYPGELLFWGFLCVSASVFSFVLLGLKTRWLAKSISGSIHPMNQRNSILGTRPQDLGAGSAVLLGEKGLWVIICSDDRLFYMFFTWFIQ